MTFLMVGALTIANQSKEKLSPSRGALEPVFTIESHSNHTVCLSLLLADRWAPLIYVCTWCDAGDGLDFTSRVQSQLGQRALHNNIHP